jgi:hypothetical protein
MHSDSQTRELRVGGWLPGQRGESDSDGSNWALSQETMLLPAFLTGTPAEVVKAADAIVSGAAAPAAAAPADPDKLPASERNMLIFVALLLATGTLAILAMATV